jgi:hypothetical protein
VTDLVVALRAVVAELDAIGASYLIVGSVAAASAPLGRRRLRSGGEPDVWQPRSGGATLSEMSRQLPPKGATSA